MLPALRCKNMTIYELQIKIKKEIASLLDSTSSLNIVISELNLIYAQVISLFPLAKPVEIEVISSNKLTSLGFYQLDPNISDEVLHIKQKGFSAYLWCETLGWCIDDESNDIKFISDRLVSTPFLDNEPRSVKELYDLLKGGIWSFNKDLFPNFAGNRPNDDIEVLSWDLKNVLIGTHIDNITVVSREEWDRLCEREIDWLK